MNKKYYFYLFYIINILLTPFFIIILAIRIIKKKEIKSKIIERFGIATTSLKKDKNKPIWLHAASIGESMIALTIIEELRRIKPNISFLITTMSASSANLVNKNLPYNVIHQMIPLDHIFFINNFISYWKPALCILIEAEWWPCLIMRSSQYMPVVLLNARISDKSFAKWRIFAIFLRFLAKNLKEIAAQSSIDQEKFHILGIKANNYGNIKLSLPPLTLNHERLKPLQNILFDKIVILLSNSHKEDMLILFELVKKLKKIYGDKIYFINILRHPEKRNIAISLCQNLALKYSLSSLKLANKLDDIYIVDEFGINAVFYHLAEIVFIGGSFEQGGHSPIEPAHFNNAIITGPNMSNYKIIVNEMIKEKAIKQTKNSNELLEVLSDLISNQKERNVMQKNSFNFLNNSKHIMQNYLNLILNNLNN